MSRFAKEIPPDFHPHSKDREMLWESYLTEKVTRLAKKYDPNRSVEAPEEEPPEEPEDFRSTWALLCRDRRRIPAHKCMLRRRLIRRFIYDLTGYSKPDTE